MMGWELHNAKASFSRFSEEWDHLNGELYHHHPYFDSRFVGPLLRHFSTGNEILCLYRNGESISGALILQPRKCGRWMSFRPSQAQITAILLKDTKHLPDLLKALPGLAWTIELIAIDPRYSPNFLCADLSTIVTSQAYTIGVHPGIEFELYWDNRSKNLKHNFRRYFNRLAKEFGTSSMTMITSPYEMKSGVYRFGAMEFAGWKGTAGTAITHTNAQGAFYSEVMQNFAEMSKSVIYELSVANQLAASLLGCVLI